MAKNPTREEEGMYYAGETPPSSAVPSKKIFRKPSRASEGMKDNFGSNPQLSKTKARKAVLNKIAGK